MCYAEACFSKHSCADVRIMQMINTRFLLNAYTLTGKRIPGNKIGKAVDGVHTIQGRSYAGNDFYTFYIKVIGAKRIGNRGAQMWCLYIHAIYQLCKTYIGGIGKTSCIDHLKTQARDYHLYSFYIFQCIKKRRGRRIFKISSIYFFDTDRRL